MEGNQTYKAVELLRVSTNPQATLGTSLNEQALACERIREAKDIALYKTYREDGKSGALYVSREDVQAAIRDIEQGRANVFITYRIDRAGRDVDVLRAIRKRVLAAGGRFIVDGMEFPDDPMSDLMFTQLASFAEWERKIIRERTVNGRKRRAVRDGQQPCRTMVPFGFTVATKQDVLNGTAPATDLGKYRHVEPAAGWAREMYHKYAAGTSMRQIRQWLKDNYVLSPEGLAEWSASTVRRLLSNPVYVGRPAFGRTKRMVDETRLERSGHNRKPLKRVDYSVSRPENEWVTLACQPLVSEAIWLRCQERLRENKARCGGNPKRRTLLGGLVVCPKCGKIVGGSKQRTGRYYACPHDRGCKWRVNAERAEEFVTRGVVGVAQTPELAQSALMAFGARKKSEYDPQTIERMKADLSALDAKESITVEAQLDAMMKKRSATIYDTKLNEIATKRAEITARLEEMEARFVGAQEPSGAAEEIAAAIASVTEALQSDLLTDVEKNEILSAVIYEVRANEDATELVVVLRPFGVGGTGAFFVPGRWVTEARMLIRVIH